MDTSWLHGDPGEMQALALTLRARADAILAVRQQIDARASELIFEGPGAPSFRNRMQVWEQVAQQAATRLTDAAQLLAHAAADVAAAQAAERAAEERAASEREASALGRGH